MVRIVDNCMSKDVAHIGCVFEGDRRGVAVCMQVHNHYTTLMVLHGCTIHKSLLNYCSLTKSTHM